MTVFLDLVELVRNRTVISLTTGPSLVILALALTMSFAREVLWAATSDSFRRRLRLLTALAMPLYVVVIVSIGWRFNAIP